MFDNARNIHEEKKISSIIYDHFECILLKRTVICLIRCFSQKYFNIIWSLKMYLSCDHQQKMSEIVQVFLSQNEHHMVLSRFKFLLPEIVLEKRNAYVSQSIRTIQPKYIWKKIRFFFRFMWRPFPKWSLCDHKRHSAQRALYLFVLVLFFPVCLGSLSISFSLSSA